MKCSILIAIICVSVTAADGQDPPKSNDLIVDPPVAVDLTNRPRLAISVTSDAILSVDGVEFTFDQVAVLLRIAVKHEPRIVIEFQTIAEGIGHCQRIMRSVKADGISDAVFILEREAKKENKAEMATPRKPSD